MSNPVAVRLKKTKSGAGSKVNEFDELLQMKCFKEIHDMVTSGWDELDIARHIKDTRNELPNYTVSGLAYFLKRYKKSLPPLHRGVALPPKAVAIVEKGIDELEEMEKLYHLQMERIQMEVGTEKKIRKLMSSLTPDIREAKSILVERAKLKMDLGITNRHLGTMNIDAVDGVSEEIALRYGNSEVAAAIQNAESRRKIAGALQTFMLLQDKKKQVGGDSDDADLPESDTDTADMNHPGVIDVEGKSDG